MRKLIIVVSILILLSGCEKVNPMNERVNATGNISEGPQNIIDFIKLKGNETEITPIEAIKETVNEYEGQFSIAFLKNDISTLKSVVKEDSRLWTVIEKMINYFYNEKIIVKQVSYEIEKIEPVGKKGKYKVYINEKLDIKYPGTIFYVYDYYWVMDIEKVDNKYLITDLNKWVEGELEKKEVVEEMEENTDNSKRRFPKLLPQYLKDDKFAMTNSAMDGVKKYIEIDYNSIDAKKRINDFKYAYGDGLISVLTDYNNRIDIIKEKKMLRKIRMQEMTYQEYHHETGLVDVGLNIYSEENGVGKETNSLYRVNLMNMGSGVWYITNIENIPVP